MSEVFLKFLVFLFFVGRGGTFKLERAETRGTNEEEIKDVINSGIFIPAKYGRLGKAKIYAFQQKRREKYYEHKWVEVIYTLDRDVVITVTVYVFYGQWENADADPL